MLVAAATAIFNMDRIRVKMLLKTITNSRMLFLRNHIQLE